MLHRAKIAGRGGGSQSADGSRLAVQLRGEASWDIWVKQLDRGPSLKLTFEGSQNVNPAWTATGFAELGPMLSPDGRWLAYASNESGMSEIYVVPFPNAADAKWAVSTGGGTEPLWSRGGREIFYRNGELDMVAVRVETAPTFSAGPTSVLFSAAGYLANGIHREYDVTPDGQQFIMLRPVDGGDEGRLILVLDFFEELRARVGG